MKRTKLTVALLVLLPFVAAAQTPDPAMLKVRTELEPVFALGRLFGYLATMEAKQPRLALSSSQAAAVSKIADKIRTVRRFDAKTAEGMLSELEDRILTVDQLQYADQLALAAGTAPGSGLGNNSGNSPQSNPFTAYLSGGAFNPITDIKTQMGKDFAAFTELLARELAR